MIKKIHRGDAPSRLQRLRPAPQEPSTGRAASVRPSVYTGGHGGCPPTSANQRSVSATTESHDDLVSNYVAAPLGEHRRPKVDSAPNRELASGTNLATTIIPVFPRLSGYVLWVRQVGPYLLFASSDGSIMVATTSSSSVSPTFVWKPDPPLLPTVTPCTGAVHLSCSGVSSAIISFEKRLPCPVSISAAAADNDAASQQFMSYQVLVEPSELQVVCSRPGSTDVMCFNGTWSFHGLYKGALDLHAIHWPSMKVTSFEFLPMSLSCIHAPYNRHPRQATPDWQSSSREIHRLYLPILFCLSRAEPANMS
ncbi:hypothetical protein CALCODRAFT_540509 [Calocera cornea HHB12733]|uniref:Uncharacterized protein n=1 Tax=Calocera cornea HHB12733 TaxID=1353952 RepID=A0A166LBY5_9BASI|nr:hypothetical protein CALCODRAFT_540509 [Calocera cornea HHB12733]